jgi:hypothetical protein
MSKALTTRPSRRTRSQTDLRYPCWRYGVEAGGETPARRAGCPGRRPGPGRALERSPAQVDELGVCAVERLVASGGRADPPCAEREVVGGDEASVVSGSRTVSRIRAHTRSADSASASASVSRSRKLRIRRRPPSSQHRSSSAGPGRRRPPRATAAEGVCTGGEGTVARRPLGGALRGSERCAVPVVSDSHQLRGGAHAVRSLGLDRYYRIENGQTMNSLGESGGLRVSRSGVLRGHVATGAAGRHASTRWPRVAVADILAAPSRRSWRRSDPPWGPRRGRWRGRGAGGTATTSIIDMRRTRGGRESHGPPGRPGRPGRAVRAVLAPLAR